MKVTKRIVSVLLALLLVFGNVSLLASAAASDVVLIDYYVNGAVGIDQTTGLAHSNY